mmetsp:Transcript_26225/g.85803  ORF Transcript_26225/g.85803 Transcript_26225/m.85803 type:complete len:208 (-) Transcript_26225:434-1057(-)
MAIERGATHSTQLANSLTLPSPHTPILYPNSSFPKTQSRRAPSRHMLFVPSLSQSHARQRGNSPAHQEEVEVPHRGEAEECALRCDRFPRRLCGGARLGEALGHAPRGGLARDEAAGRDALAHANKIGMGSARGGEILRLRDSFPRQLCGGASLCARDEAAGRDALAQADELSVGRARGGELLRLHRRQRRLVRSGGEVVRGGERRE